VNFSSWSARGGVPTRRYRWGRRLCLPIPPSNWRSGAAGPPTFFLIFSRLHRSALARGSFWGRRPVPRCLRPFNKIHALGSLARPTCAEQPRRSKVRPSRAQPVTDCDCSELGGPSAQSNCKPRTIRLVPPASRLFAPPWPNCSQWRVYRNKGPR